jgi:integrase
LLHDGKSVALHHHRQLNRLCKQFGSPVLSLLNQLNAPAEAGKRRAVLFASNVCVASRGKRITLRKRQPTQGYGEKTRRCPPLDRERAIGIIHRAIALAAQGNGRLVRKMTLRQAMNRYHNVVRKAGMTGENAPHSLRYSYATEHLQRARKAGIDRREAAAGVSTLLGHGDGRGTWVERVYGRKALAAEEVSDA